jgi:hypothetical protein
MLFMGMPPRSVLGSPIPRKRDGAYPMDLEVDGHGYPSDMAIECISMVSLRDAGPWLYREFPRVWRQMAPYARVDVRDEADITAKPCRRIYVATGGWSGCESVINAVMGHPVMRTYCREQLSGGGYTFEVPHDTVEDAR